MLAMPHGWKLCAEEGWCFTLSITVTLANHWGLWAHVCRRRRTALSWVCNKHCWMKLLSDRWEQVSGWKSAGSQIQKQRISTKCFFLKYLQWEGPNPNVFIKPTHDFRSTELVYACNEVMVVCIRWKKTMCDIFALLQSRQLIPTNGR